MSKRLNKIHPHKSKIQEQLFVFQTHIDIQTDRQTYTQAGGQKDRQADTDRHAGRQVASQKDRRADRKRQTDRQTQTDAKAGRQSERQTGRHRQTCRQARRQTDRRTQRQANRHTETGRQTGGHVYRLTHLCEPFVLIPAQFQCKSLTLSRSIPSTDFC